MIGPLSLRETGVVLDCVCVMGGESCGSNGHHCVGGDRPGLSAAGLDLRCLPPSPSSQSLSSLSLLSLLLLLLILLFLLPCSRVVAVVVVTIFVCL